ncbi:MAG: glycine zipper domain-containing protein [Planctomycetota bacterium]
MPSPAFRSILFVWAALVPIVLSGCQSGGQTGALAGAGLGALAGQAIGSDTEATLIGAAVGGGIGYIVGNEQGKKQPAGAARRDAEPVARRSQPSPIAGTRWRLVSLNPSDLIPPYASKVVEFRSDGVVVTTTTATDGSVTIEEETYRIVDDTLVITTPDDLINARFDVSGGLLTIRAENFSAVLERL